MRALTEHMPVIYMQSMYRADILEQFDGASDLKARYTILSIAIHTNNPKHNSDSCVVALVSSVT